MLLFTIIVSTLNLGLLRTSKHRGLWFPPLEALLRNEDKIEIEFLFILFLSLLLFFTLFFIQFSDVYIQVDR